MKNISEDDEIMDEDFVITEEEMSVTDDEEEPEEKRKLTSGMSTGCVILFYLAIIFIIFMILSFVGLYEFVSSHGGAIK